MDRDAALARLPAAYGRALRLAAEGKDETAIATALGLDATAIAPLLEVGEAKLTHLLSAQAVDAPERGPDAVSGAG